jgi:uncharacterized membrane protein (UPF0182 family)
MSCCRAVSSISDDTCHRGRRSLYAYFGTLSFTGRRTIETPNRRRSAFVDTAFILAGAFGWGYYLDRFDLLYSTTGVVYGVGYTAGHVTLLALWAMIGVSAAACMLLVFNLFRPRWKAMAIGGSPTWRCTLSA